MLHEIENNAVRTLGVPAAPMNGACDDYAVVREVLRYVTEHHDEQPELASIAAHVCMDPTRLHKLFVRWAGLTPKAFLAAVTLDHAKRLLDRSASVLDAALEVGLSGPGRLHDLFVTHEAMSPGAYKARGEGLTIRYGVHASPFGRALLMATDRGLCGLSFCEDGDGDAFAEMRRRWPRATYVEDAAATAPYARRAFERETWRADTPLRVVMIGSDFELRVWEALLAVPPGQATSYGALAERIGKPKAARAVGAAVGRNPLSFVVPCHRVLGAGGALTGYHWGLTRKRAMLGWETGASASE